MTTTMVSQLPLTVALGTSPEFCNEFFTQQPMLQIFSSSVMQHTALQHIKRMFAKVGAFIQRDQLCSHPVPVVVPGPHAQPACNTPQVAELRDQGYCTWNTDGEQVAVLIEPAPVAGLCSHPFLLAQSVATQRWIIFAWDAALTSCASQPDQTGGESLGLGTLFRCVRTFATCIDFHSVLFWNGTPCIDQFGGASTISTWFSQQLDLLYRPLMQLADPTTTADMRHYLATTTGAWSSFQLVGRCDQFHLMPVMWFLRPWIHVRHLGHIISALLKRTPPNSVWSQRMAGSAHQWMLELTEQWLPMLHTELVTVPVKGLLLRSLAIANTTSGRDTSLPRDHTFEWLREPAVNFCYDPTANRGTGGITSNGISSGWPLDQHSSELLQTFCRANSLLTTCRKVRVQCTWAGRWILTKVLGLIITDAEMTRLPTHNKGFDLAGSASALTDRSDEPDSTPYECAQLITLIAATPTLTELLDIVRPHPCTSCERELISELESPTLLAMAQLRRAQALARDMRSVFRISSGPYTALPPTRAHRHRPRARAAIPKQPTPRPIVLLHPLRAQPSIHAHIPAFDLGPSAWTSERSLFGNGKDPAPTSPQPACSMTLTILAWLVENRACARID